MGQKLIDIAAGMVSRLAVAREPQGYVLPCGLNLRLTQVGNRRSLRLSRERVRPSADEIAVCWRAFEIPTCAEVREVAAVAPWVAVALTWKV